MGAEAHTLIGDLAKLGEAEDLEAARIGKNCARPGHERVQTAELPDQLVTGTKIQVIGVGKNYGGAERFQVFLGERLNRRGGPDRHEYRSFDDAVRSAETATPRTGGIAGQDFKR